MVYNFGMGGFQTKNERLKTLYAREWRSFSAQPRRVHGTDATSYTLRIYVNPVAKLAIAGINMGVAAPGQQRPGRSLDGGYQLPSSHHFQSLKLPLPSGHSLDRF